MKDITIDFKIEAITYTSQGPFMILTKLDNTPGTSLVVPDASHYMPGQIVTMTIAIKDNNPLGNSIYM